MSRIKLESVDETQKVILNFLNANASDELAAKINNGKKTLSQCMGYIYGEARKLADKGYACVKDETVFGWAIHFFEEDEIQGKDVSNIPVKTVVSANAKEAQKVKKQKMVKAPEFEGAEQIGFDFFGG